MVYFYLMFPFLVWASDDGSKKSPSLSEEETKLVKLCLVGMRDGRERLASVMFEAHGQHSEHGAGVQSFVRPVKIQYVADFVSDRLRIEWDEPIKVSDAENPGKSADVRNCISKFIRTPKHSWRWSTENERVVVQASPDAPIQLFLRAFDVRAVGLSATFGFENGMPLNEITSILGKQTVLEAVEESDTGLCRLVWVFGPNRDLKRTVWCDPLKGFVPLRLEVRRAVDIARDQWEETPLDVAEVTWVERFGEWIPQTLSMTKHAGVLVSNWELAFEWQSVNDSLDEGLFTPNTLDVPRKTQIVSEELGKPVIVGYAYPAGQSPDELAASARAERPWWVVGIVVTTLTIGMVLLVIWWKGNMVVRRD